jgi:hypothetical protein
MTKKVTTLTSQVIILADGYNVFASVKLHDGTTTSGTVHTEGRTFTVTKINNESTWKEFQDGPVASLQQLRSREADTFTASLPPVINEDIWGD